MNDGKIIMDKILADANAAAKVILEKGQQEAAAIQKAAEEKAEKQAELNRKLAKAEAEKALAKEISGAEMQAKRMLLETKQALLADVIAEAEKRLLSLDDAAYAEVIGNMLDRLDPALGTEIIVSARDWSRLAAVIQEKGFTLSTKSGDISGGFIVKNGAIEYNYSFTSILAVEKEEIQQAAAAILF